MAESTMSPAFAQTPVNPNIASTPAAANVDAPQETPSPSNGGAPAQSLIDQIQPAPAAHTQHAPVSPQPAPQQPAVQATPQGVSWQEYEQLRARAQQLEQQSLVAQQQLNEQNTTINNLLQMQQEYDNLRRQASAANIDYGELTTVDTDDAKKIGAGIMKAVADQLAPLQQALTQQQQQFQQSTAQQERNFTAQRMRATLDRVLDAHPDFEQLQNDPAFGRYLQQKDGLSSYTLDDRAKQEFLRGNYAYINNLVAQYKAQKPNTGAITSVAPVQTATTPVNTAAPGVGLPTLHELNSMMQMRQITADQYREYLAKIRAAQNQ